MFKIKLTWDKGAARGRRRRVPEQELGFACPLASSSWPRAIRDRGRDRAAAAGRWPVGEGTLRGSAVRHRRPPGRRPLPFFSKKKLYWTWNLTKIKWKSFSKPITSTLGKVHWRCSLKDSLKFTKARIWIICHLMWNFSNLNTTSVANF